MTAHIFCIFIFAWMLIGIVMAVSVAVSFVRKYERSEERVAELELRLGPGERVTPPNTPAPHFMERFWHGKDKRPEYRADSRSSNQLLVYGSSKFGEGCSVCNIMDDGTVYAPIAGERLMWLDCRFTRWAYVDEIMPVEQKDQAITTL